MDRSALESFCREHDLVLRRAPALLQHQVGTHGRALFEDQPGRFDLFRVHAWELFLDESIAEPGKIPKRAATGR